MASVQSDGLDDILFDMYKKQVLNHLRSKMTPEMFRTLATLKDGGVGTSDLGVCKLRLDSFLASMVAGEDFHTSDVSESFLSGLRSRLESMFGSVLSKAISGIVGLVALRGSKMPSMHEEIEKIVVDVLKFLVDSSCIKINGSVFLTPPLKRKDGNCKSPTTPAKRFAKMGNPTKHPYGAKVLFPEVQDNHVIDGATMRMEDDCEVVFVKEVNLNDKLNKMSEISDAMYNKNNGVGSKVDEGAATVRNAQPPSVSFVIDEGRNDNAGCISIPESARFPLTPRQKMAYNAVFSLAKSKHARSSIVDIGNCNVTYFSLGESMAPRNEVCSYVINALCRKNFLDEPPTISRKHYFFSSISDVFLSESTDYSYVEKSFAGAASVLHLHLCDSLHFPVMFENHWFLFVVDLKRKFFMFLDSHYSKDDEFSTYTRNKLGASAMHGLSLLVRLQDLMSSWQVILVFQNKKLKLTTAFF